MYSRNCRHSFHPYIHGTARTWTEEQIKALDEKSIEYNGEKYTEYEASQIQRGLEREIRSLKRQIAALEEVGGDAGAERARLRKANKAYTDFTENTGLKKQQARTKIATGKGVERPAPNKNSEETVIEKIGRSVGAKAKNYDVYNPKTGEIIHLSEGTRITQPKNHVIAGAGRNREIDDIDFLLDKYGGDSVKWTKEKGFGYVNDEYGEQRRVELHWYQEPTIDGKHEMKIKVQPDGRIYLDED